MKHNRKEVHNRRKAKKHQKEKARKLRRKQQRVCAEKERIRDHRREQQRMRAEKERIRDHRREQQNASSGSNTVAINSPNDWLDFVRSDAVRKNPLSGMTVLPLDSDGMLGKEGSPGAFSFFCLGKLTAILEELESGKVSLDSLSIRVVWSRDNACEKLGDSSCDAESLMGFPIGPLYRDGVFRKETLPSVADMVEEEVRNIRATYEKSKNVKLKSFGVCFRPVEGPFVESQKWKDFSEEADLVREEIVRKTEGEDSKDNVGLSVRSPRR